MIIIIPQCVIHDRRWQKWVYRQIVAVDERDLNMRSAVLDTHETQVEVKYREAEHV